MVLHQRVSDMLGHMLGHMLGTAWQKYSEWQCIREPATQQRMQDLGKCHAFHQPLL